MDGDLEHCIHEASGPFSIYDSDRAVPANKLLPIDLNISEGLEGDCCHFSIRGYVARVHKSEKNICWPFFPIREHILDNDENLLPPISVAQFRWWKCENCLVKDDTTKNGKLRECLSGGEIIHDVSIPGKGDAIVQNHLVSSLLEPTAPVLEVMPHNEYHKSADNGGGRAGESCILGLKVSQDGMLTEEMISGEQCQVGDQHDIESERLHSISKLSFPQLNDTVMTGLHYGNAHGDFNTMPKHVAINNEQTPESEFPKERILDNDTPDSALRKDGNQMPELSSGDLDRQNCEPPTVLDDTIVESEEDEHIDQSGDGSGTVNRRKVRRTRALSDIIKSEVTRGSIRVSQTSECVTRDVKDREMKHKNQTVQAISGHETASNQDNLSADHRGENYVKEEVMHTCKKHNKFKIIPAVSGDEPTHVDDRNSGKIAPVKDSNVKHTSKKHVNVKSIPVSSADEVTNADGISNDIRKTDNIKALGKHICKKHKSTVSSIISDVKATRTTDMDRRKIDNLNEEITHVLREHDVTQDKQRKKNKLKKRLELLETEDDGSSLIHWMKRTSKEIEAFKRNADSKYVDSKDLYSPKISSPIVRTPRYKDPPSSQANDTKKIVKKQKSSVGQQGLVKQRSDIMVYSASQGGFKEIKSGNSYPKLMKAPGTAFSLNLKSPKHSRQSEKATGCNLHDEMTQGKDNRNSLISRQKDSGSLFEDKVIDDGGKCSKASKKQTSEREEHTTDTPSVDGIPLEILKLLQENFEKRHSDESTIVKTGSLITEIKDGKGENHATPRAHETSQEPLKQHRELLKPQHHQDCTTKVILEGLLKPHKQQPNLDYMPGTASYRLIQPCEQQPYQMPSSGHHPRELELLSPSAKNHLEETPMLTLGNRYDFTGKRNICMDSEYQVIAKCKNLKSPSKQWDMYATFPEFPNSRKHANDGMGSCLSSINGNKFCLQDRDRPWVMSARNNQIESCNTAHHISNGYCKDFQASISMGPTFLGIRESPTPNIPVDDKGNGVLSKGASAKRKRKRTIKVPEYRKAFDRKIAQLQKQEVVNLQRCMNRPASELSYVRPEKEYNVGTVRQLDLRTNETISALNLLKLMDPAVCSRSPVCGSSDKNSGTLNEQSNCTYKYVPKGSFRGSSGEMINEENKNPHLLDNVNPHYHSGSSNFYGSMPRIGVPVPFYLKESTTGSLSHNPRTYRAFMETDKGEARAYLQSNTINVGNPSGSQSKVFPCYSFLSNDNLEAPLNCQTPTNLFCAKLVQVGEQRFGVGATQIRKNSCSTELCSVNRNPADFTIPCEDNEYMTGYEDSQLERLSLLDGRELPVYPENCRKRKALSLIATKGLLRS